MIISLVGFMGCGKTSVGCMLAEEMGAFFIDQDNLIEELEGMEIMQIFQQKGEKYFRKKENEVLKRILSSEKRHFVLSTGGGIILSEENRTLLQQKTFCIFF